MGLADDDADAHAGKTIRLRERAPDQHVGIARHIGQERLATELDIGLVHEDDRVWSSLGDAPKIVVRNQLPGRIVRGVEEDHFRARCNRRDHLVDLKHVSRTRGNRYRPRTDGDRGVGIGIKRGQRHDRLGVVCARASDVANRGHQDAFVESVGQQHPIRIDVEVRSARMHERGVGGIRRHIARLDAANRLEHPR